MKHIPVAIDMIQEIEGNLIVPEIRVWCHPHRIGKKGDDYYQTFPTFIHALHFITKHPEAERTPLIAFKGYEINLFGMKEKRNKKMRIVNLPNMKGRGKYGLIGKIDGKFIIANETFRTKKAAKNALTTEIAKKAQKESKVKNLEIIKLKSW